jgi:tRNA dimethylallyltransferase
MKIKSYIIAGPTASGKSDFAHSLAQRVNGVVINCDSVQIYKGIENLSASPLVDDIGDVPYKLFSILPLSEHMNVADYLRLARAEYDAALALGKTPIFVGGTGFYINAIINGISPIPDVSPENRTRARETIAQNPHMAKPDPQRASRALEVLLETGKSLSEWQQMPRTGAFTPTPFKILINPPREILLPRIAARIPKMLSNGALDEALGAEGRAIGAESLSKFLRGEITQNDAINEWITRTNQYAKRQRTWFKSQYGADLEFNSIPTDKDLDNV